MPRSSDAFSSRMRSLPQKKENRKQTHRFSEERWTHVDVGGEKEPNRIEPNQIMEPFHGNDIINNINRNYNGNDGNGNRTAVQNRTDGDLT